MFKGDRNFTVGLFVTIAIAALVVFVIWLTGRSGAEEMSRYTLLFPRDVSGLAVGGPVKYMGMNVGSVVQMQLDRSEGVRVRVDIDILTTTPVDQGTYASLALQGITGVAVVNLASEAGDYAPLPDPPRGQHPVIPVRDVGFAALMASAPEIMNKLDRLLTHAGDLLGPENQAVVQSTLQNVNGITESLAASREALGALPGEISRTLAEIRGAVGEMQGLVSDARPDLTAALENVNRTSENLLQLSARLDGLAEQHGDDVGRFLEEGLAEAPALMQQARAALRELDKLVAELRHDPSQLVHRRPEDTLEVEP